MTAVTDLTVEQCVALKLMLDIRFFDAGAGSAAVLELPADLADGLAALQPGGVILFRENLANVEQCQHLTQALRDCISPAALIATDQEGGRVTRLPRDQFTSFSGNMAVAACPAPERESLAQAMARAQAAELAALGININFAPTLDVNSNPHNPVINVRAFGDSPAVVAALGARVVQGLQCGGVAAAVKHFPGHGDTSEDSHTHLPRVDRDRDAAQEIDLAPFAAVIQHAPPALVMTAHIQYPALDSSCLPGTDIVRPATLSRAINSDLLRAQLGFEGVVISDALDMRAISELLSPEEAVVACFQAGVDIALMPLLVRTPDSLQRLQELVSSVAAAVASGVLDEAELRRSAARVLALQSRYEMKTLTSEGQSPVSSIACSAHLDLERRIAEHSITLVKGELRPLCAGSAVHLLMPDSSTAMALASALLNAEPGLDISWHCLDAFNMEQERAQVDAAEVYIVGSREPATGAVELGGAEDIDNIPDTTPASVQAHLLQAAAGRQRIALLMGSPYGAGELAAVAEAVLASYDSAVVGVGGEPGPAYKALARVLIGGVTAAGQLPITLNDA